MVYDPFRTRAPSLLSPPIDVGRAEVLLNCFDAPQLNTPADLKKFVGSLHSATNGNPAVLPLLIEGFRQWHEFNNDSSRTTLELLWTSFDHVPWVASDPVATLKAFCSEPPFPLPPSMVHAIFDDPSFDFVAYLNWHNEGDA